MESYVRGDSATALIEDTIGTVFDRAVATWPDREALVAVEQGIRWTFAEFGRRVDDLAAGLLARGLQRGDRVGIWAPNLAEWTLTQFATAKAGLIQVNINPAYRLSELEFTLNKVGVKALIAAERFKTSDYVAMVEALAPEIADAAPGALAARALPHLKLVVKIGGPPRPGWLDFADIADSDHAGLAAVAAQLDARHAINIQFTSGTTGLPKGATPVSSGARQAWAPATGSPRPCRSIIVSAW